MPNGKRLKTALVLLAAVLAAAFWLFSKKNYREGNHLKIPDLNVAFPSSSSPDAYEPTRINLAPEYIFLENIFSPLVEINTKGEITSGIAKSFEWHGSEAHFTIRDDLKTVDGIAIDASDVEFSLKRLLVLTGNTHGNFNELVCGGKKLNTVNELCKGIRRIGNTIIIDPGTRKPFLFPMLAAIDFAIVPQKSVDGTTLEITDYRNTSGPYYVQGFGSSGVIELSANENHYRYHEQMPQKIRLIPSDKISSFELYREGKVDLITTVDAHRPEEQLEFFETIDNAELHQTLNIRTFMARFTARGLGEIDHAKRLSFGKALRKGLSDYVKNAKGFEESIQFFPVFGEGELKAKERIKIEEAYARSTGDVEDLEIQIIFRRVGSQEIFEKNLAPLMPKAIFIDGAKPKSADQEEPHVIISGPDTGYLEDIGLLSYSINFGMLTHTKDEGTKWLAEYMEIDDKDKRLEKLRDLHFKALSDAIIVPFARSPYVAIVRKPWTHGLLRFYANNPFYFMRYNGN